MDVRLPDGSGIEACREIRAGRPETRMLFLLTSFADDDAVLDTILAGADGFMLKEVSGDELMRAVRSVASGVKIWILASPDGYLPRSSLFPPQPMTGSKH